MPLIKNKTVLNVLQNSYFDHHAAMHLARERLILPSGKKEKLFLPPHRACQDCDTMKEAGTPGSGTEFLQMHHEMIRVFRFLLDQQDVQLLPVWEDGRWQPAKPCKPDYYSPQLWDLDDPRALPEEIVGMFNETDPEYLGLVFKGVQQRVNADRKHWSEAIDELGRFIERGVDLKANSKAKPDGSGFHNTMHEYLGSLEGKQAPGAEMNKLRNSMYNDYFWSLHLWIDAQYGRLLEHCGKPFADGGLDPEKLEMFTHKQPHGMASGMSMM